LNSYSDFNPTVITEARQRYVRIRDEVRKQFPFSYQKIDSTTWAYLSSLLLVALFFKFNRFWSIRNLDLLLIILLAPGLLMIESGRYQTAQSVRQSAPIETSTTLDPSVPNTPTSVTSAKAVCSFSLVVCF